jgi:hypothetical protein
VNSRLLTPFVYIYLRFGFLAGGAGCKTELSFFFGGGFVLSFFFGGGFV